MLRGVIALAGFLPQHDRRASPFFYSAQVQSAEQGRAGRTSLPRYLIIHGTHDEAVPIERAREAHSILENHGATVEYHEHRVGHKVSAQGLKEIGRWVAAALQEF